MGTYNMYRLVWTMLSRALVGYRSALALHPLFQVTVHQTSHLTLQEGSVQEVLQQWRDTV